MNTNTPSPQAPHTARSSTLGAVYVLLSAVMFSTAGVLIKAIPWGSLSISGARSIFAAAVIFAYLKSQGKNFRINLPIVVGAAINYAMLQTFVLANKLTTAANAIVLQFTEPVWVIILMLLIWKERPNRAAIISSAVALAGVVCFFFDRLSPTGMLGNVIAVVSGLAYAGVFLIKRVPSCDFECAAILSFLACTVTGIPSLLTETDFSPAILLFVVLLGVLQLGLSYIFLSKGLDSVSPLAASLLSMLEPVLNPIWTALLLGETVGPIALVGCVLVLGSATAYNLYSIRKH